MTDYKQLCAELVELGSSPARSVSELAERMSQLMDLVDRARAARRPKQPSLKEEALQALALLKVDASTHGLGFDSSTIRRALEQLDD